MKITPRIYAEAYYEAVKAAPVKEVSAVTRRLLTSLQRRRHWAMLPKILRAFDEVLYEREGLAAVTLITAYSHTTELEKAWIKRVLDAIFPATSARRQVELTKRINPELIGGIHLTTRGYSYDASVKNMLALMKGKLQQAPLTNDSEL